MGPDPHRDVGQLLWVGFEGTEAPDALLAQIAEGQVGAVVLFSRNLARRDDPALDIPAIQSLIGALRAAVPPELPPLLVAIDQEGGRVQRIKAPATEWPPMLGIERVGDEHDIIAFAFSLGRAIGDELAAVGVDLDFAPVLDVHTNPDNPIIGDRAFGTRAEAVADRALAFARGLRDAGVIACGKHFPGHGDTNTDSHLELPRIDHDLARLRAVELLPFARAAADKLPTLMTAHVVFAAVDPDQPATLSPAVVEGVLRRELGYRGVVISDDLDMKAIADRMEPGEAALRTVGAGCDALLLCRDMHAQQAAREALTAAARTSASVRERIGAAAAAVRALKAPLAGRPAVEVARARRVLGCAAHRALRDRLAAPESRG